MYTTFDQLKPEHFELWVNGVLWVTDKDVLLAIARGEIAEFIPLNSQCWRYPLTLRRTTYGLTHVMGSGDVAKMIKKGLFPSHADSALWNPDDLSVHTEILIDPLIREGVLIMGHDPATYGGEQDLYWPEDAWFVANLKNTMTAHMP